MAISWFLVVRYEFGSKSLNSLNRKLVQKSPDFTKSFRYQKMEVLYLIGLFWGGVSLTLALHKAYIGEYHYFRCMHEMFGEDSTRFRIDYFRALEASMS